MSVDRLRLLLDAFARLEGRCKGLEGRGGLVQRERGLEGSGYANNDSIASNRATKLIID